MKQFKYTSSFYDLGTKGILLIHYIYYLFPTYFFSRLTTHKYADLILQNNHYSIITAIVGISKIHKCHRAQIILTVNFGGNRKMTLHMEINSYPLFCLLTFEI